MTSGAVIARSCGVSWRSGAPRWPPAPRAIEYPQEMSESVVVITGASAGIGAALAEVVAGRGMPVVLVARRQQPLEAVAARCGGAPPVVAPRRFGCPPGGRGVARTPARPRGGGGRGHNTRPG